jgi:lipoprotein-anchoring transpeptidase ErfK/SrfK
MTPRFLLTLAGMIAALALAGCSSSQEGVSGTAKQVFTSEYGSVKDAGYRIPAVPISKVKERYHRQIVSYRTREKPGTIIVDTPNRYLYFVLPGRKAVRYGIGVGKAGFAWEGEAYIAWKQAWPKWTPPKEMIQRRPDLARYGKDGMKPGLRQPARCPRPLSLQPGWRGHIVPPAWHTGMELYRNCRLIGLHPADEPGHHRPL